MERVGQRVLSEVKGKQVRSADQVRQLEHVEQDVEYRRKQFRILAPKIINERALHKGDVRLRGMGSRTDKASHQGCPERGV